MKKNKKIKEVDQRPVGCLGCAVSGMGQNVVGSTEGGVVAEGRMAAFCVKHNYGLKSVPLNFHSHELKFG